MMRALRQLLLLFCCLTVAAPALAAPANCPNTSLPRPSPNLSSLEIGMCATRYTGIAYQPYEFTTKLVACIEGTIRHAVYIMMNIIAIQFAWVTSVLATLVIVFFGVRVATGERELLKRTATLFIKLAIIVAFMNKLPTIIDAVFGALQQLLSLVVGGVSPWQRIDAFLGKFMGFSAGVSMINGLVGLIGAAIFSSKVGITVFFFGILAVMNLLVFILELIFTYLLAFLTIGFLLMLTPVMLPLALFFYTERYFKKWTEIIVSAILTPVLLFAFIWMFVGIFDTLINNIFDILGGNDFRAYWRLNTSLCSWMMPSDPNTNVMMQRLSTAQDVPCVQRGMHAPVQLNISPFSKNSFDACAGRMATLNFGANDVNIMQRLGFSFITLWIFSSLMKSMIHMIPQIAQSITSVVNTHIPIGGNSTIVSRLKGGLAKTEHQLQTGKINSVSGFTSQLASLLGNRDK